MAANEAAPSVTKGCKRVRWPSPTENSRYGLSPRREWCCSRPDRCASRPWRGDGRGCRDRAVRRGGYTSHRSHAGQGINTLFKFGECAAAVAAILGQGDGPARQSPAPTSNWSDNASSFFAALCI